MNEREIELDAKIDDSKAKLNQIYEILGSVNSP